MVLEKGKLCASRSKTSPHNTFFPFNIRSMQLPSSGTVVQELGRSSVLSPWVRPEDVPRYGPTVRFKAVELLDEELVSKRLMEHILSFLQDHPGVRLVVASPGPRPEIPNVHVLYVKGHGRVWKAQHSGNCLLAAVTNGIDVVLGRGAARQFFAHAQGEAFEVHSCE